MQRTYSRLNEPFFTTPFPCDCLGTIVSFLCNVSEFDQFRLVSMQFYGASSNFFRHKFHAFNCLLADVGNIPPYLIPEMYVPLETNCDINRTLLSMHDQHKQLEKRVLCGLTVGPGYPFLSLHLQDTRIPDDTVLICVFGNAMELMKTLVYNEGRAPQTPKTMDNTSFNISTVERLLCGGTVDYQQLLHYREDVHYDSETEANSSEISQLCDQQKCCFYLHFMCAVFITVGGLLSLLTALVLT